MSYNFVVKPSEDFLALRPTSKAMSITYRNVYTSQGPSRTEVLNRPRSCPSQTKYRDGDVDVERILGPRVKQHVNSLSQAFQAIDISDSGRVSQPDFFNIVDEFCDMPLTSKQMEELVKKFGDSGNGCVFYAKFLANFNNRLNTAKQIRRDSPDNIENQLKSKLLGGYSSAVKAMKLFDYNKNGFIQKQELKKVLEIFCPKMTESNFEKIWIKYDRDNHGSMLNYMEFLEDMGARPLRNYEHKSPRMNVAKVMVWGGTKKTPPRKITTKTVAIKTPSPIQENLEEIEQAFKMKFREKYEAIARAVAKLDHRASGYVSLKEFKNIIVSYTVGMSDHSFNTLLERCGITVSHRIHYERFMDFYGEARSNILWQPQVKEINQDIFTMLRSHSDFPRIKEAFLELDYNKDGKISRAELRRIVEQFSFRFSEEDYTRLMARVDPEHKGYISYHRFLEIFDNKEPVKTHAIEETEVVENKVRLPTPPDRKHQSPDSEVEQALKHLVVGHFYDFVQRFVDNDNNHTGSVSFSTLQRIIEENGLQICDHQFNQIWNKLPQNEDGTIQYNRFLAHYSNTQDGLRKDTSETPPEQPTKPKVHVRARSAPMTSSHRQRSPMTPQCDEITQKLTIPHGKPAHRRITTPLANVKDIEEKIKEKIIARLEDLRGVFRKQDEQKLGVVTLQQFKDVLFNCDIPLTPVEIRCLWRKYDNFETGSISYTEFLKRFTDDSYQKRSNNEKFIYRSKLQPTRIPYSPGLITDQLATLTSRLRQQIQGNWKSMRRSFRALDPKGNGSCSTLAFRHVLRKYNIEVSDEEFYHVCSYYDKDLRGRIPYNEFLGAHIN